MFLAAKTTNYPVLIDAFIPKFAKLQASDVISTEFLVAQSLNFEFWVRGAEKGARGWFLEFQVSPLSIPFNILKIIQLIEYQGTTKYSNLNTPICSPQYSTRTLSIPFNRFGIHSYTFSNCFRSMVYFLP